MEDVILRWLATAIDAIGRNAGTVVMVLIPAWAFRRVSRSALGAVIRDRVRGSSDPSPAPEFADALGTRIAELEQRALAVRGRR